MTAPKYEQARPWCLPCRREGSRVHAQHLGIACEWHWGILSESDQAAMTEMVRRWHPRGGRVRNHIEQVVIVRMHLRTGDIPNTIERRWQEDWDENVVPFQEEMAR